MKLILKKYKKRNLKGLLQQQNIQTNNSNDLT